MGGWETEPFNGVCGLSEKVQEFRVLFLRRREENRFGAVTGVFPREVGE